MPSKSHSIFRTKKQYYQLSMAPLRFKKLKSTQTPLFQLAAPLPLQKKLADAFRFN